MCDAISRLFSERANLNPQTKLAQTAVPNIWPSPPKSLALPLLLFHAPNSDLLHLSKHSERMMYTSANPSYYRTSSE